MESWTHRLARETRETAAAIDAVLAGPPEGWLAGLNALRTRTNFGAEVARWGPPVWRYDRVRARPFLVANVAAQRIVPRVGPFGTTIDWAPTWTADPAGLAAWLTELDEADDVSVFRAIYELSLSAAKDRHQAFRDDLVARLKAAPHRRLATLARLDLPGLTLDEAACLVLFDGRVDAASRDFFARHRPTAPWGRPPQDLARLLARAKALDEDLYVDVYRHHAGPERWREDVLRLAKEVRDPAALQAALHAHHPARAHAAVGPGLVALVRLRGDDVRAYVTAHASAFGGATAGLDELAVLARDRGWVDVWGRLMRGDARSGRWNKAIHQLTSDRALPSPERRRWLLALAGGEGGGATLDDDAATALYRYDPTLVRGRFASHLSPRWGAPYQDLLHAAIANQDDTLVDRLAADAATTVGIERWPAKQRPPIEVYVGVYTALDEARFAARAARVLGHLGAHEVWSYDLLVRTNPLARLLFERSAGRLLDDPAVIRDLLESPNLQVQVLALRALARDDARARIAAAANVDLLLPMLLRRLHRNTRLRAFGALRSAADAEPVATTILTRARDALSLPDQGYPKDALVALIGALLFRWPALRRPAEVPTVHRDASAP